MRQEQQQGNTEDECTLMTNVKSARLKHNKRANRILTPIVIVFAVTMLPLRSLPCIALCILTAHDLLRY